MGFSFDSLFNRLKIRGRDGARENGVRAMNSYAALCKVATSMVKVVELKARLNCNHFFERTAQI